MEAKYSKGGKRSQNTPPVNTQTPPIIANANREVHSTPNGDNTTQTPIPPPALSYCNRKKKKTKEVRK